MSDKKIYAPIKVPDYRVVRPTVFLEKGGNTIASVQQLSLLEINGCKIEFITPNSITLSYNKSWKEYQSALKIYDEIIRPNLVPDNTFNINSNLLGELYDYFEHIQSSIISIYSAIEALGNVAIPNNYTLSIKNNKGVTEIWNKANIERWKSTTEKIGKLVPNILEIPSPNTQWFWKDFLVLKDIRDEIIHQKQSAMDSRKVDESFLSLLLNDTVFSKIMAGFALIKYFCDHDKKHLYFPILEDEIPIDVNIVESFDGVFSFDQK